MVPWSVPPSVFFCFLGGPEKQYPPTAYQHTVDSDGDATIRHDTINCLLYEKGLSAYGGEPVVVSNIYKSTNITGRIHLHYVIVIRN